MKDAAPVFSEAPAIQERAKSLLTITELALRWGIPKATLYNWVNQNRIPYLKLGRCIRFAIEDIHRFEDRSRMGTAKPR